MINRHIRVQSRVFTDHRAQAHHAIGTDPSPSADHGMIFNDGSGVNTGRRIHFSSNGHGSMRMNAACKFGFKFLHNLKCKGKPRIGIRRNHHRTGAFFAINLFFIFLTKDNDPGLTVFDFTDIFRIGQKGHFIGFGMT